MASFQAPVPEQEWYRCSIPRKELKAYLARDNYHGLIHMGLWFVVLAGLGVVAFVAIGTYWVLPAFLLYGVVYSSANALWHECSHGTVFKTGWLNTAGYFLFGAMELRDTIEFRWSHTRHHSLTLHSGIDPEIPTKRPPNLGLFLLDFFYIYNGFVALKNILLHSIGIVSKKARDYVPPDEYRAMFWAARGVLLVQAIPIAAAIYFQSILPVLFFGLPRFYGAFLQFTFIAQQHAGLPENTWDHRINTRSFRLSVPMRFLFMNMEHHIEHHMFPMVPFHALAELSNRIKGEMPVPYFMLYGRGFWEMVRALLVQRKDPQYSIEKTIPEASGT